MIVKKEARLRPMFQNHSLQNLISPIEFFSIFYKYPIVSLN